MTTIYLSSTYEDLKDYRRAVIDALRKSDYDVRTMEDYVAGDQWPAAKCLDDVRDADIYVGIFAFRYGYIPQNQEYNPNGLSITELEFRQAESLKKPCLIFVAKEEAQGFSLKMVDAFTGEGLKGEKVNKLRQYLLNEKLTSSFSEPHQLSTVVLAAVKKHLDRVKRPEPLASPVRTVSKTWDIEKDGSPYPGLMHFTRRYAPVFFGREAEVNEILDRMRTTEGRFIIISGGSGTGKSSLVDAGVLPRVEESGLPGMARCVCKRMVPSQGNHPFDALMRVLHSEAERAGIDPFETGQRLLSEPSICSELLRTIISQGMSADGLVLFLDQMEELFTGQTKERTTTFISALYAVVNEVPLRVIGTIRSDFLHYCHEHDDLLKVLRGSGHYPLGRVENYVIADIIAKPAQCAGLSISEGLMRRLIRDTGSEPGSLPLLAFALEQLFKKRSDSVLSEDVYAELGGIAGAVGAHVNTVEDRLAKEFGADANTWLLKIFPSLVVVNIDGQPTRRRALKKTLASDLQPIVDYLSRERLLSAEGEGPQSTVSVAHEKLFETWPALTRWVAENRDDFFVLRQAEIEAKEWVKYNYDVQYLWHIDRLQRLRDIVQRVGAHDIDAIVRQYFAPQDRLIERLHENLLSHQDRLTIGQYLAALGDPRRGVGLTANGLPDIQWLDIPGGTVKLEEVKRGFKVKPFRIAKYLVTNVQFQAFIAAEDGYQNAKWWQDITQSSAPTSSTSSEHNCPRTDVSWYEAVAFCRWLSERLAKKIRLPAEWEWQQAATGGDASNMYPWGPEWEVARCNSTESDLRRTTAVGVYPKGATRQGVLDMAGNVWEWCQNKYENPDAPSAMGESGGGRRVLRGGFWNNLPMDLRSSFRYRGIADFRNYGIGFRLAQDIE